MLNRLLIPFIFNLMVSIFCYSTCYAQRIKIGDRLPDNIITDIYNYPKQQFRLSEFNAKLILLDFWSPSCGSCLESFPVLDSLQKLFKGQVQIILVNKESLDSTRHLFSKRKFLFKPNVPFITGDTRLNKLFSVYGLPAEAWLDNSGKYYGYTEGRPTSNEIRAFLNGMDTVKLAHGRKRKYLPDLFDPQYRNSIKYYSVISQPIDGVGISGSDVGKDGLCYYDSILGLYKTAYDPNNEQKFFQPGRTIVETNDSIRYFRPKDDNLKREWYAKYSFTYSLLLPPERNAEKFKVMQADLSRYFGIRVTIEKRYVNCLVLVRTSNVDKIRTHSAKPKDTFMMNSARGEIYGPTRILTNQPFKLFSKRLEGYIEYQNNKPFLDQTGYTGNLDIEVRGNLIDGGTLANWRKTLNLYDLDLIQKDCLLDVLVLNDKN